MKNDESNERIDRPGEEVTQQFTTGTNGDAVYEYSDEICAAFQARIAERMETGEDLGEDPHLKTCTRCNALISDLEAIAEAARLFMQTTEDEPPETLWEKIESAIHPHDDLPHHLALEGGSV